MNVIADYIVDSNRIGELSPTHVLLVDKGASVELKGPLRVVVETNFGPAADFKPPYDGKGYFTRFAKIVDIPEGATETVEIIEDTPDTNLGRVSDNMSIAIMLVVLPEPDKAQAKQMWEKEHSFLQGMVGIAKKEKQVPEDAQQASDRSLSEILVGKQWQAQSQTLAGQGLVITFMANGEFSGQLTGASYTTPAQPVKGKWQVIEPHLFLDYVYNAQVDSGFTMQVIPTSAQIQIHITQASASKLMGVDQFARAWEWERIG